MPTILSSFEVKTERPPLSQPCNAAYEPRSTTTIVKVIDPAMRRVIQPIEGRRSRVALKGFRTENHRCQFLMAAFEYSGVSRLASVRGRLIPLRSRWCLSTRVAQGYVRRL